MTENGALLPTKRIFCDSATNAP